MELSVWDATVVAAKTIVYAATLGAAGAVLFVGLCGQLIASGDRLKIRRIVRGLALLAVAAGAAQIMAAAGSMSGDAAGTVDGSLLHMVLQAGAARANGLRALGLLLAAFGVARDRPPTWWGYAGAVMAATSFAWTGHATALKPNVLPVLLQSVHLLGAAFWLGALAPLLIVARDTDLRRIAGAAARFGVAAVFVVAALVTAGAALLTMLLGDFTALANTTYGRCVMVKLALVACMLCMGSFNKLRLTPRLLAGDPSAARSLRASIRVELLLGALILTVTATFTTVGAPPGVRYGAAAAAAMRLQLRASSLVLHEVTTCEFCKFWAPS
jgi:putative copper export protein